MTARLSARAIAEALGRPQPTPEQQAVIEAPLEPVLVVAGAGSGKTETMTSRVVWLVANGLAAPEQILGLTFTRKAAGELADRVRLRLLQLQEAGLWTPPVDDDGALSVTAVPTISTYHAYAGRIVGEHGLRVGIEPDTRLLGEAAAWQLVDDIVGRFDGPLDEVARAVKQKVPARSTLVDAVLSLSGELAEHLVPLDHLDDHLERLDERLTGLPDGPEPGTRVPASKTKGANDLLARTRMRRELLPLLREYARVKREADLVDFADQMALAAALARTAPEVPALERQRFRVVLLDEFQDTSEAQLVLLASLFAAGDDAVPVMAVGDPHQSIYGWRGASATTLTRFPAEFSWQGAAARVLSLSTSWRNDAAVLDAANVVAAPLRAGSAVPVPSLSARPDAGPGRIDLARHETVEQEAAAVAQWIAAQRLGAEPGRVRTSAVLCRKRSQFEPIVAALEEAGLPVEVVGLGGLLRAPEILDLVALLAVVDDPSRGDRLMRLLAGPVLRLGPRDLAALASWASTLRRRVELTQAQALAEATGGDAEPSVSSVSSASSAAVGSAASAARLEAKVVEQMDPIGIVEALDELPPPGWVGTDGRALSEPARARLRWLRSVVAQVRALGGFGLADLVLEAQRLLGLDVEVLARPDGPRARRHLDRFVDIAADFAAGADTPSLTAFLAWLEAADERERGLAPASEEPDPTAVSVLTVHAAKGLEWDVVAVPGLVETTFPAYEHGRVSRGDDGEWQIAPPTDSGWLTSLAALPYDLRGDRDGLPRLDWEGPGSRLELTESIERFRRGAGAHGLVEERRLAYVALTRARSTLLVTAHVWGTAKKPRVTSRFLVEVRDALAGDSRLRQGTWAEMPSEEAPANPRDGVTVEAAWPVPADPHGTAGRAAAVVARYDGVGRPDRDPLADEAARLLVERAQARARRPAVELPAHLSTSALVQLAADAERFATELRRPMPAAPARSARRGTAFHAWVESYYGEPAMLDLDELPGSADEGALDESDLEAMQAAFLASEWSARAPLEVERSVETVVDGIAVRGRIDAVFGRDDGGVTIVDWKTGVEPTGAVARARAVQLSAYRIAYARLTGRALEQVDAAFFYATSGRTVRPELVSLDELRALLPAPEGG